MKWVLLKRDDIYQHAQLWSRIGICKPYHIEPYERYLKFPPRNWHYQLFGVYDSAEEAMLASHDDLQQELLSCACIHKPKEVSLGTRFKVFRRDRYRCQLCGASASDGARLEIDHKVPRAKDGGSDEDNLWTLCFQCNRGKGSKSL